MPDLISSIFWMQRGCLVQKFLMPLSVRRLIFILLKDLLLRLILVMFVSMLRSYPAPPFPSTIDFKFRGFFFALVGGA